jgi:hypothetical protein
MVVRGMSIDPRQMVADCVSSADIVPGRSAAAAL